jgi:Uma2 family endonuclease
MTTITTRPLPAFSRATVPPLRTGDHLDRATFHERYCATPEDFRAELVRGVVYVSSPVHSPHGRMQATVLTWLGVYKAGTKGVDVLDNTSTEILDDDEFQPDAQLIVLPEYGGQGVQVGKLVSGAPHLVVEVASSSAAYDLFEKFEDYERAGVLEYAVVLLDKPEVRWFVRRNDAFVRLVPDADGAFRSVTFPGLWLDESALLLDDAARLLAVLQQGLATPDHAAFVQRLAAARQAQQSSPAQPAE